MSRKVKTIGWAGFVLEAQDRWQKHDSETKDRRNLSANMSSWGYVDRRDASLNSFATVSVPRKSSLADSYQSCEGKAIKAVGLKQR